MNENPVIRGEALFKAVWPRRSSSGVRILAGRAALADEAHFLVDYGEGASESLAQSAPNGWMRTRSAALRDLEVRLARAARHLDYDLLAVRARIQAVKNLRARLAEVAK